MKRKIAKHKASGQISKKIIKLILLLFSNSMKTMIKIKKYPVSMKEYQMIMMSINIQIKFLQISKKPVFLCQNVSVLILSKKETLIIVILIIKKSLPGHVSKKMIKQVS